MRSKKRGIGLLALTAIALAAFIGQAQAAVTLDVRPTGGTYNSIQAAINAAPITTDTVVIRVAQGIYRENIDIYTAFNLTIQGGWNSTFTNRDTNRVTIANGDESGSEIDIWGNSDVKIDGLTVTHGNSTSGGGLDIDSSEVTVKNSRIVRNDATDDSEGGGINSYDSSVTVEDSLIASNISDNGGGGFYVYGGSLIVRDSVIRDNKVGTYYTSEGGGMYITNGADVVLENTKVLDNIAHDYYGGGIYSYYSDLTITNGLIAGNYTVDEGSGIYFEGDGNDLSILNSTIAHNGTEEPVDSPAGAGVYVNDYGPNLTIKNSILYGNWAGTDTPPGVQTSDLGLDFSDMSGVSISDSDIGSAYDENGNPMAVTGPGNISADPVFVDVHDGFIDATGADFSLSGGSPAIDTADSSGAPATDIDGIARPQGAGFDMGAFENHAPTATLTTPYISSTIRRGKNFDVSWTGSDPSGSSSGLLYDVWFKVGQSGTWRRWLDWTGTTRRRFYGKTGTTYYFKVKAKDSDGIVGPFSTEQVTLVPFDGLHIRYIESRRGFGIKLRTSISNYGRSLRSSRTAGDNITFKYGKTNQINLIVKKGPRHGRARIFIDGVNKGVIETKAATKKARQLVFTADFASYGSHRIKVVNLGTRGRPTIDIDGLGVRR